MPGYDARAGADLGRPALVTDRRTRGRGLRRHQARDRAGQPARWRNQVVVTVCLRSYRLLALGPGGNDAVAIFSSRDGSAWLVRARPGGADQRLQLLRPADEVTVSVVTWAADGVTLEGLLALPAGAGPHPMFVFLHGGPVAGLACGEHPDPSEWVSSGLAVFMPDFRSSGIGGRQHMHQAFHRREIPAEDPEVGDVLTGVDPAHRPRPGRLR
jgi:dipeptidyl aminopeptidase/acylaminoacyl peptidase